MNEIQKNRTFMHCPSFEKGMGLSDQKKGLPHPEHEIVKTGNFIELKHFTEELENLSYMKLLDIRRSGRVYKDEKMTQEQLAFMLWSAHGIQEYRGAGNIATFRPVASGGARHPFELYVVVKNVEGLESGIYHYCPTKHVGEKRVTVEFICSLDNSGHYEEKISAMVAGQKWATKAPVILFVSCIPYRAEWRYNTASHRVMLIDLGHIGQNIMLSAASLGLGSCCIAAFDQKKCDEVLNFDGMDEYTVYVVTVGSVE